MRNQEAGETGNTQMREALQWIRRAFPGWFWRTGGCLAYRGCVVPVRLYTLSVFRHADRERTCSLYDRAAGQSHVTHWVS